MTRMLAIFFLGCFGYLNAFASESMRANNGQIIEPGTSKLEVLQWQGKPDMADTDKNSRLETWSYTRDGGTYLVYFSNSKVKRIDFQR